MKRTLRFAPWLFPLTIGCASQLTVQSQVIESTTITRQEGAFFIAWRGPAGWNHVVQFSPQLPPNDTGTLGPQPSKQYHAVYFTTDTCHVEVGWNHVHDNRTCRAIQFHSSPLCQPDCGPTDRTGFNQHHLVVHDNLIHGDVCDGINFATVDPSQGPVLAYNNVIYDVGQGPPPPDGDANYSGIHVAGGTNTGREGMGVVEIFNNTLFNCGGRALLPEAIGDEGAFSRGPGSPDLIMQLRNNIVVAASGEQYLAPSSATSLQELALRWESMFALALPLARFWRHYLRQPSLWTSLPMPKSLPNRSERWATERLTRWPSHQTAPGY